MPVAVGANVAEARRVVGVANGDVAEMGAGDPHPAIRAPRAIQSKVLKLDFTLDFVKTNIPQGENLVGYFSFGNDVTAIPPQR